MKKAEYPFQGYGESDYASFSSVFLRLRGVIVGCCSTILSSIVFMSDPPFWVVAIWGLPAFVGWMIQLTALAILVLTVIILIFRLRARSIATFRERRALRRWQSEIVKRLERPLSANLRTVARLCTDGAVSLFCGIESGLKILSYKGGIDHIGSAIRIDIGEGGHWCYRTFSRAGLLKPEREDTSEPLTNDSLLLKTLAGRALAGYPVLICNDVELAQEMNCLEKDKNSYLYEGEVKSFLIARLFTWDAEKKGRSQIGLLYITADEKNWFRASHVDLAVTIAHTFEVLSLYVMK